MPHTIDSVRSTSRRSAHVLGAILGILVAGAAIPAGIAQTTLVDVTIQAPYGPEAFDDPAGWSASVPVPPARPAPTASWQWGAPTSGPGVAASGTNVWATNLSGNYANNACSGLMSPPIDLTNATSASVSFKHWRHFELLSSLGTAYDGGIIMVTPDDSRTLNVVTATGYNASNVPGTTLRTCWNAAPTTVRGYAGPLGTALPPPVYATSSASLSAYLGQTVRVVFAFGSDSIGQRAGWYVDDVALTINGVTTTQDFEASDGGFTQVGTKVAPPPALGWSHGVPTDGPANATGMWATNPAGNHGPNECAWVESPPIDLGPLPGEAGPVASVTLFWSQWYRASSASSAGVVQIGTADGNYTNIVPTTGYPSNPSSAELRACTDHAATGAFAGFLNAVGADAVPYEADITAFLGKTITVRFLFASTSSTFTYPGWAVDDVAIETALEVTLPNPEDLIPDDLGLPVGGTDAPGWSHGGENSTWAFGVALSGPTNETVYKTNLTGNYKNYDCSWIESPTVPAALLSLNASMSFDHWYEIESIYSSSSYDGGVLLMSVDGGNWTYVSLPEYDRSNTMSYLDACLVKNGQAPDLMVFSGNHPSWETVTVDLSAYATAQSVQFRWLFGSDYSVTYDGWAIKNVMVGGVKIL